VATEDFEPRANGLQSFNGRQHQWCYSQGERNWVGHSDVGSVSMSIEDPAGNRMLKERDEENSSSLGTVLVCSFLVRLYIRYGGTVG
jgi:hypothetical protein